jgi:formylglycine-generating enzyme required for sulfatase activity
MYLPCRVLLLLLVFGLIGCPGGEPEAAVPVRLGWHDEAMPEGIDRADERNVYLWQNDNLKKAGVAVEMVYVPPGDFVMGSDNADDREKPRHTHAMPRGYYIGRFETRLEEYEAFVSATGHDAGADWRSKGQPEAADLPVDRLNWGDANAFCDWAGLRLPSEAQWEKAARGTDGRTYPWGDEEPGATHCNLKGDADGHRWKAPVGAYLSGVSPYGAHDMVGNVSEFCETPWEEDYARFYRGDFSTRPGDGMRTPRAVRGGCWQQKAEVVRATSRHASKGRSRATFPFGFRPVVSSP